MFNKKKKQPEKGNKTALTGYTQHVSNSRGKMRFTALILLCVTQQVYSRHIKSFFLIALATFVLFLVFVLSITNISCISLSHWKLVNQ